MGSTLDIRKDARSGTFRAWITIKRDMTSPWISAIQTTDIPDGGCRVVTINLISIIIVHKNNNYFALEKHMHT